MRIKDLMKGIGGFVAFIGFFFLLFLILAAFIKGAEYLAVTIEPILAKLAWPLFALCLIVFLPLSFFKKTRSIGLTSLVVSSFVFGLLAWMLGFIATLYFWGVFWLIVGLFLAGIGVVPMGIVASFLNHRSDIAWSLIIVLVIAYGIRIFALWYEEKMATGPHLSNGDDVIDLGDEFVSTDYTTQPTLDIKPHGHHPKHIKHQIPKRRVQG